MAVKKCPLPFKEPVRLGHPLEWDFLTIEKWFLEQAKQDRQRSSTKLRPPYKKKNTVCWETLFSFSIGFSCCFLFHQLFLMKLVSDVFGGHIYFCVHCCNMYRGSCIVYMALFEWKYISNWFFLTKVGFLFLKEITSVPNLHIEGTDIYAKFRVWPKI